MKGAVTEPSKLSRPSFNSEVDGRWLMQPATAYFEESRRLRQQFSNDSPGGLRLSAAFRTHALRRAGDQLKSVEATAFGATASSREP